VPTETAEEVLLEGTLGSHHTASMDATPATGYSHIMSWDGRGWQVLWISDADTEAITVGVIRSSYNEYRNWWGHAGRVYYMPLPTSVVVPTETKTQEYDSRTHEHLFPQFDDGRSDQNKVALRVRVDARGLSANETIIVAHDINQTGTFTALTPTMTVSGITTYEFPTNTNSVGLDFRTIQIRLQGVRGSTLTNTPDVLRVEFEYLPYQDIKWGFEFVISLDMEYPDGGTPEQMREFLFTAAENGALIPFTYRNRDANALGTTNPYNYNVKVLSLEDLERTGDDWHGQVKLLVVEG